MIDSQIKIQHRDTYDHSLAQGSGETEKRNPVFGYLVEDRFKKSIEAVQTENLQLAQFIIDTDFEIDEREIEVEEECLKTLALYQPVATDLRLIIAVIKINSDLERIADYACSIAYRFRSSSSNSSRFQYDYSVMAEQASSMLKKSLDSLVTMDVGLAREVREMDQQVNQIRNDAYAVMKKNIQENPEMAGEIINMYLISRHIERIGDHSTSTAEEVIYLIEGQIIRHT